MPRDRLVKLQGTLSGNSKDGGNVEDDARLLELDRYLPRLLFHREELRSLIGKYSQVTRRNYEQYQAGYDAAAQAQMIQTTSVTSEEDNDQLSSICTKFFLSRNIKDGGNMGDDARLLEFVWDSVNRAADHAISATHDKATTRTIRKVYQEEDIEGIARLDRLQLQNSIDPIYDPVSKEMSKNCTELGGTTVLHRDKAIDTHSYIQAYFKSIKGYGKKVTEEKERYAMALATAAANHRERRKYLRTTHKVLVVVGF